MNNNENPNKDVLPDTNKNLELKNNISNMENNTNDSTNNFNNVSDKDLNVVSNENDLNTKKVTEADVSFANNYNSAQNNFMNDIKGGIPKSGIVNAVSEEKEESGHSQATQEVEIKSGDKTSGFKYFLAFSSFVILLLFVLFLPDINSYVRNFLAGKKAIQDQAAITTGTLKCTLSRTTSNFDVDYEQLFTYTDNKLEKLTYKIKTKGDATLDEDELDKMSEKCDTTSNLTESMSGITVACDLDNGTLTEKHMFDYASLNAESVTSAYTESGGVFPEYKFGQDMNQIEKSKKAEGFTCVRAR